MIYTDIHGWFSWQVICDEFVEKSSQENSIIVELGTWLGCSTAYQAQKIKESGKNIKFFTVDTFQGAIDELLHVEMVSKHGGSLYKTFLDNMEKCGVLDFVKPLEMTSEEASRNFENESIDFLFIDAGHRYEDVIIDLKSWYPKVKKGGIIAGHDWPHPPLVQATRDFFGENYKNLETRINGSIWYYQN